MAANDLFDLGVELMDSEHRELAQLLDEFIRCIKEDPASADAIVQRAIACANAHFEHEEELIAKTGYPQAEDHKFRHRHLRLQMTTLVGDTVGSRGRDPVTLENLDSMRALLVGHIAGPDRELAAYLKAAGIK